METIHFLDDSNNLVEAGDATKVVIRETDDEGKLISETYGCVNNHRPTRDGKMEISPEVQAFVEEFMQEHKEAKKR